MTPRKTILGQKYNEFSPEAKKYNFLSLLSQIYEYIKSWRALKFNNLWFEKVKLMQ